MVERSVLLVQYARIPTPQRKDFLKEHPELISEGVVGIALIAAKARMALFEYDAGANYAFVAFEIARELQLHDWAAKAADLVGEACAQMGKKETAFKWTYLAEQIRTDRDYMGL